MTSLVWLAAVAVVGLLAATVGRRAVRGYARRAARRAVLRSRARIDRFKLTGRKPFVMAALLGDPAVAEAVRQHAVDQRLPQDQVWRRVSQYVDEIVPFFNVLLYYNIGYRVARAVLHLFYDVTVGYARPEAMRRAPKDAVVIYLMNHRSNADYVLAGYALSGRVAISYAVGEWARVFPLEYVFKSFGSYFIRRRYREPLYHTVLERYVQLITRNGVTQGIFPEGGLSRDGRLQPAKIGLLDYILGVARDTTFRRRLYVVPVAINYDRVLEDRSLLRERDVRQGGTPPPRLRQLGEVVHYTLWNLLRLAGRRWQRYGRAAVLIGEPMPLAPWFDTLGGQGVDLFALSKAERLAQVQALCDQVMARIGELIPVTPVPLVCAALQSLDRDFVRRDELMARIAELREVLAELNSRGVDDAALAGGRDRLAVAEAAFDRAYCLLRMRRVLARHGNGYVMLPHGRELVSYYANSVAHLLGAYESAVRARDALPSDAIAAGTPGGVRVHAG